MMTTICRSCGALDLHPILSLGETPLANSLLGQEHLSTPEARFPLELIFCASCSLVQINFSVPPESLFRHYVYLSSFSTTMLGHAQSLAHRLMRDRQLSRTSLVLEVASNDGYLLQYYKQQGVPVLGIEPAENIAAIAEGKGIPTRPEFFGHELALRLQSEGIAADVIHANNVLAHVPDLNGFVSGLRAILKADGVAVIEVPYVKDLIDHVEFDTIYHEHLCYFSLTALTHLFARHGLTIVDVERIPIHGGSLRIFAAHTNSTSRADTVQPLLEEEAAWGVASYAFYRGFGEQVETLKTELVTLLKRLKADGKRIAAYGASAKGSTLLNYCGIGAEILDFVADRSTVKQNLYTPGTHLHIRPPEHLLENRPDYVLLLAWNFAEEIMAQQSSYREQGGRFIIPVPLPHIL